MKNLDLVIKHLKDIDDGFYGQIVILVREGKAVRVEEQRVFQLDKKDTRRTGSQSQEINEMLTSGVGSTTLRQGMNSQWQRPHAGRSTGTQFRS